MAGIVASYSFAGSEAGTGAPGSGKGWADVVEIMNELSDVTLDGADGALERAGAPLAVDISCENGCREADGILTGAQEGALGSGTKKSSSNGSCDGMADEQILPGNWSFEPPLTRAVPAEPEKLNSARRQDLDPPTRRSHSRPNCSSYSRKARLMTQTQPKLARTSSRRPALTSGSSESGSIRACSMAVGASMPARIRVAA